MKMKPKFISDTLTHWTGRNKTDNEAFEIIEKIINSRKLLLTYCPNYPNLSKKGNMKIMMVCFTDIPIELSHEHCSRFGSFGIGFSKEKFIKYGANPVLYTTDKMNDTVQIYISFLQKLHSLEVDRDWKDARLNKGVGDYYQFTEEEFNSFFEITSLLQNYMYNANSIDYYQREWRINYETLPIVVGEEEQSIPGQGKIFGTVNDKVCGSMLFDSSDVDYIVVKRRFEKRAKELMKPFKGVVKIYEDEIN